MKKTLLKINFIASWSGLLIGFSQFYLVFLLYLGGILFRKNLYVSIINKLFFIYLCYLFIFHVSIVIILNTFDYSLSQILSRYTTQNISLILIFFQIYIGFLLLQYVNYEQIMKLFKIITYVFLVVALYQILAHKFGLPYLGRYAFDPAIGVRLSSVAGDPKNFSIILVIALFFFKDLLIYSKKTKDKIFYFSIISIIFFMYFKTGSANGYLALVILSATHIWFWNKKFFIVFTLVILILTGFIINYYHLLGLRESHVLVFELMAFNTHSVYDVLDDLLLLPFLAWIDNPEMLIFGFGKGLMHFYAYQYIDYANWLKGSGVFIDATIGIISIISDFGILFSLFLYFYIINIYKKLNSKLVTVIEKRFLNFIFYTFIVGFFIFYNTGIFFFGSIGILLFLNEKYQKNKTIVKG